MDPQLFLEQKEKQLQYCQCKYEYNSGLVNLRKLINIKTHNTNTIKKLKTLLSNAISRFNSNKNIKNIKLGKFKSILKLIFEKINKENSCELANIVNLFIKKYNICGFYNEIIKEVNTQLKKFNRFRELWSGFNHNGSKYELSDRDKRILRDYGLFRWSFNEFSIIKEKGVYFTIPEFRAKYHEDIMFLKSFVENKNRFLADMKNNQTKFNILTEQINLESKKIADIQHIIIILEQKKCSKSDEVHRAEIDIEIAQHKLTLKKQKKESDKVIKNLTSERNQLCNNTVNMSDVINTKLTEYCDYIEGIRDLIITKLDENDISFNENNIKLETIKNKQSERIKNLKNILEPVVKIKTEEHNFASRFNSNRIGFLNEFEQNTRFVYQKIDFENSNDLNYSSTLQFLEKIPSIFLDEQITNEIRKFNTIEVNIKKNIFTKNYSPTGITYSPTQLYFDNFLKEMTVNHKDINSYLISNMMMSYVLDNDNDNDNDNIIKYLSEIIEKKICLFQKEINNININIELEEEKISTLNILIEEKKELMDQINSKVELEKVKLEIINFN